MSKGSLELPLNIQLLNNEGEVALSWGDNSGVGNASDTDFAMPLVYNTNKRVAIYDMVSSCRGDEGVSLSYPSDWVGDTVHITWVLWLRMVLWSRIRLMWVKR